MDFRAEPAGKHQVYQFHPAHPAKPSVDNLPTAYVCQLPVTDPAALAEQPGV